MIKSIKNKKYLIINSVSLSLYIAIVFTLSFLGFKHVVVLGGGLIISIGLLINVYLIIYIRKKLFTNASILVSYHGIEFIYRRKKTMLKWVDVIDIDLFSRNGAFNMEAISISKEKYKKPLLIYYSKYTNGRQIGQYINYAFTSLKNGIPIDLDKFTPVQIDPLQSTEYRFEKFKYVSKKPWINLRSYAPLYGISMLYVLFTVKIDSPIAILIILFSAVLTILMGFKGMNRVGISNDYLQIENFYFEFGKTYRMGDIKQVFIENPGGKSPNTLRIITTDYKSKTFQIANFTKKKWLELEDVLEAKNILVVNKLYPKTKFGR